MASSGSKAILSLLILLAPTGCADDEDETSTQPVPQSPFLGTWICTQYVFTSLRPNTPPGEQTVTVEADADGGLTFRFEGDPANSETPVTAT